MHGKYHLAATTTKHLHFPFRIWSTYSVHSALVWEIRFRWVLPPSQTSSYGCVSGREPLSRRTTRQAV